MQKKAGLNPRAGRRRFPLNADGPAPDATSIIDTHREAHGLLPARILRVSAGEAAPLTDAKQLFLDIHDFGAGNITAQAVAAAHEKDLQVQGQFGVRFINYWVDDAAGEVLCLSEAPDAAAVVETHRHAHGLLPQLVVKVTQGRQPKSRRARVTLRGDQRDPTSITPPSADGSVPAAVHVSPQTTR